MTAKAGLVDIGYLKATGHSIQMVLPKTAGMPEMELEWKVPEKSNAIERDRARTYHQAYSALVGLHCLEKALAEIRAGRTKSWRDFKVPEEAVSVGFHEAARGVLSPPHGDPRGQDRELPAVPADTVERQPARRLRHAGPVRGRGAEHADLRGERARRTSRASTSCGPSGRFDPCLPCGVHMYTGAGKVRRSSTRPTGLS